MALRNFFFLCLLLLIPSVSGNLLSKISDFGNTIIEKAQDVVKTVSDAYNTVKTKVEEAINTVTEKYEIVKSKIEVPPDWHCGTESLRITEIAAHTLISLNCGDQVKQHINKACQTHDNCYRLNHGEKLRLVCDRDFCKNLNEANFKAPPEGRCPNAANTLCSAVAFGKFAHKPHTTTTPMTTTASAKQNELSDFFMSADPSNSLKRKFTILDFKGYFLLG